MIYKDYSKTLRGAHAFLSPSSNSWVNYPPEKLIASYIKQQQIVMGTKLHAFAKDCIELKQRLPDNTTTLSMFVNDAIGFRMKPEQILYYSQLAFGTADAICFHDNLLRIHDLKTGETPSSMTQLMLYAALFCLDYEVKPSKIKVELRIYQSDAIQEHTPSSGSINTLMTKIIDYDKILSDFLNNK